MTRLAWAAVGLAVAVAAIPGCDKGKSTAADGGGGGAAAQTPPGGEPGSDSAKMMQNKAAVPGMTPPTGSGAAPARPPGSFGQPTVLAPDGGAEPPAPAAPPAAPPTRPPGSFGQPTVLAPDGGAAPPAATDPDLPAPPPAGTVQFAADAPQVAAARRASENNLKQIMLAMHNHHDAYNFFPAGVYDASGARPGLSWRVALLPFLEQDGLYKQFKLDEPWDGPTNKKLIPKMPKVFAVPGAKVADGLTYYRAVVGKDAGLTPPPAGKAGMPAPGGRLAGVTDGLSNTAFVVEAADPVVWTKPDDLPFALKDPLPKLGGLFADRFHVALGDGSVRRIPKATDEKVIRAMLSARGGEVIELP